MALNATIKTKYNGNLEDVYPETTMEQVKGLNEELASINSEVGVAVATAAAAGKRIIKTSTQWTTDNTVLAEGQVGFESDTRYTKTGDGNTPWNSLSYDASATAGSASGGGSGGSNVTNTLQIKEYNSTSGEYETILTGADSLNVKIYNSTSGEYEDLYQ